MVRKFWGFTAVICVKLKVKLICVLVDDMSGKKIRTFFNKKLS